MIWSLLKVTWMWLWQCWHIVAECQQRYFKAWPQVSPKLCLCVGIVSCRMCNIPLWFFCESLLTWKSEGNWKEGTGRDLRDRRREKGSEGSKKGWGGLGEMRERDVIYVWSRFTPSSPYHETSPGGDNHTSADVCVCERVGVWMCVCSCNCLWVHLCLCVVYLYINMCIEVCAHVSLNWGVYQWAETS